MQDMQQQPAYSEHVSGAPLLPPPEESNFRPAYPSAPYLWQPPKPKRDTYLQVIAIISFIGSILITLGGMACVAFAALFTVIPPQRLRITPDQLFSVEVLFITLAVVGIIGGICCLYHSFRALFLRKPSSDFRLPWFWSFFLIYIVVLIIGVMLRDNGQALASLAGAIFLIALAGVLPALTVLSLGVRRVHAPGNIRWPTTWRRFTFAIIGGATLSIGLAGVLELLLVQSATSWLGVRNFSLNNPQSYDLQDPRIILLFFVIVAIIAPIVEEAVKPLAAVVLIGRINSAAEAFVLGLSCGIGFDLIETSSYISQGYSNWVDIAIQRSTTGLLHGFGAAMMTLGWYYLTHPQHGKRRLWLVLGCWLYAILQHAFWNGSFVLQLLPDPVGPYLANGVITLGTIQFPAFTLVYVGLALLMLAFFIYVTGKLRTQKPASMQANDTRMFSLNAPNPFAPH